MYCALFKTLVVVVCVCFVLLLFLNGVHAERCPSLGRSRLKCRRLVPQNGTALI